MAGNHARRAALAHLIAGVAPLNLGGLPVGVAQSSGPTFQSTHSFLCDRAGSGPNADKQVTTVS